MSIINEDERREITEEERRDAELSVIVHASRQLQATTRLAIAKSAALWGGAIGAGLLGVAGLIWGWGHHLPAPVLVQAPVYVSPPRMFSEEASKAKVSFTVFFTVPGAPGSEVVSGHNFKSTEDSEPTDSYCYAAFSKSDGSSVTIHLGKNGKAELPSKNVAPPPFNLLPLSVAFQACHWPEKKG